MKFVWKGNHHSYYGVFFIAFGLFNWYMAVGNGSLESLIPFWQVFISVGAFMIIDDVIEHKLTADTPLRVIYRMLFKVKE